MDLLEEARLRYPKGTVFDNRNIRAMVSGTKTVEGGWNYYGDDVVVDTIHGERYTLYDKGLDTWADIVQKGGESSPVNVYSIY